tara:strand:- start:13 stop:585 length:573 start_codon:yes stop_codon:yes gene_type:complete
MTDVPHSVEDFGQYYESLADQPENCELEIIGPPAESPLQTDITLALVAGEGRAEDHLSALAYHRAELSRVEGHLEAQIEKATAWAQKRGQTIANAIAWHERCLEAWFKSTGAKSASLIHGKLKNIKGREQVDIIDEDAIPQEYLREKITYDPDKKRILAALKETGEIVPGTEVVRSEDKIVIDTPKPVAP